MKRRDGMRNVAAFPAQQWRQEERGLVLAPQAHSLLGLGWSRGRQGPALTPSTPPPLAHLVGPSLADSDIWAPAAMLHPTSGQEGPIK